MPRVEAISAFLREPHPRWDRRDTAIAIAAVVAILVRWGDRARYFLTWDAHMFALALERYDVNALRPHAPGYPVYVALGKLANLVFADANEAFIAVSMLGSAGGAVLTYTIGRRLFDRATALGATVLLLASPQVHIHAMTTNSYAAELTFATLVALAALWCRDNPRPRRVLALAVAFGVAVGVRQSLGLFLAPMVAWAALRPPWGWRAQARRLGPGLLAGAAVGLAWFIPMVVASGGLAVWRRANALQSQVVFEHPVWRDGPSMLLVNLDRMQLYLRWEAMVVLPIVGVLAAVGLGLHLARGGRLPRWSALPSTTRTTIAFLLVWALPAWIFYLAVYSGYGNGPSGYTLLLLPPMTLAAAWIALASLRRFPWPRPASALAATVALAVAVTGLVSHAHDAADIDYRVNDAWAENWSHLRDGFPPENTSIVTAYNFAHLWFYEPDYHVYEYRPAGKAVGEVPDFLLIQESYQHEATPDWYDEIADHRTPLNHTLPAGTDVLVLFDFQLAGENGGDRAVKPEIPVREAFLPNGWRILVVDVTPDRPLLEDYFTLEDIGTG
ncbi:MAG: glycosyltransferase family 39 protein [Candidatus Thermoplasmatota archaeon]